MCFCPYMYCPKCDILPKIQLQTVNNTSVFSLQCGVLNRKWSGSGGIGERGGSIGTQLERTFEFLKFYRPTTGKASRLVDILHTACLVSVIIYRPNYIVVSLPAWAS